MKNQKLNIMIKISLLSAIAFLLMFLEMPLPFFPAFLKIDISDLPALLAAFAFGPVSGIVVELMKNVLHVAIKGTQSMLIGELANFLVGAIIVYVSGAIYRRNKTRKSAIIGLTVGSVAMAVGAAVLNVTVFLPLYAKFMHFTIDDIKNYIFAAILPFNFLKAIVVSLVTLGLYKSLSPLLHKEAMYIDENKQELSKS
jgi:riboflavin transporter FmnP